MKLIDKSALVAEIEKLRDELQEKVETSDFITGEVFIMNYFISLLDTLEVKEVDLEKELESWRHNHFHGRRDKEESGEYLERVTQLDIAKHFFELGITVSKAQKGEEA